MRRLLLRVLLALAGVVLLALLLLGAVLLEAHVEMQRLASAAPPLPERPALEAAVVGAAGGRGPERIRYVNSGTQPWPEGRRGTYGGFLLEWADGRAFLIDVGMSREDTIAFGRVLELALGAAPVRAHGSVGERLGSASRRVAGVAFTHLHSDHTDGMPELCEAIGRDVPVFQTPDQASRGNYGTEPARRVVAEAECTRFEELSGGPLHAVPGFPGLTALAAGGHTPGSTLYFADVAGTIWVIAGDISNAKQNLTNDVPKSAVYSYLIVPEARGRLGQLRRWLAALDAAPRYRVVVSHDLDAIEASGMQSWE
jgi:glyoxylase-like metal-dependent hydrolase (beta-lactamase superfamily II)